MRGPPSLMGMNRSIAAKLIRCFCGKIYDLTDCPHCPSCLAVPCLAAPSMPGEPVAVSVEPQVLRGEAASVSQPARSGGRVTVRIAAALRQFKYFGAGAVMAAVLFVAGWGVFHRAPQPISDDIVVEDG